MTPDSFLAAATRILLFTGKGGVGKTSLACAAACCLASRGKRVLLVSTDPASNLDEVLETRLCGDPTPIPDAPGLYALNIDPEASAAAYRDRVVGPYRGVLPAATVASMEEQLSGACTVEIAAFDEFTKLLGEPSATAGYDHIVFDTAPTGHTIRLLRLPAAWTGFIATNTTGNSCLGPLAGLAERQELYAASLVALADPETTTLILVSRPERSALQEAERTRLELAALGMKNQQLIINGCYHAGDRDDALAVAMEERFTSALGEMPAGLGQLPSLAVPLLAESPMGVEGLRTVLGKRNLYAATVVTADSLDWPGLSSLIDDLEAQGPGLIMAMGKGGVGKTTIAAAIALELAARGYTVHLSTTDPAAHVMHLIGEPMDRLRVSRIDPAAETARYVAEVLGDSRPHLDEQGLALLEEDLRSPCTEEIAVFRAFAEAVADNSIDFLVLDTAPTGHTLLLLDATEAYHREVTRTRSDMPEPVRTLLPRLRDAAYTRVVLVTLAEATPVHEAARLQNDLGRAGISVYAWVVNQSLSAATVRDALLARRAAAEGPYLREVSQLADRRAVVPWMVKEPAGAGALREMVGESKAAVGARNTDA